MIGSTADPPTATTTAHPEWARHPIAAALTGWLPILENLAATRRAWRSAVPAAGCAHNPSMSGPTAHVVADSISEDGIRLTTMEVRLHRFVLAELNTHRVFSRNSASSRALPVAKQIQAVREDPAVPVEFGAKRAGMQSG